MAKIRILNEFKPNLRLLTAYNHEHYHHADWIGWLQSVCCAFGATFTFLSQCVIIVLGVWYLIENSDGKQSLFVALPVQVSVVQMALTYIALIWKNRAIVETINELDTVINQRTF